MPSIGRATHARSLPMFRVTFLSETEAHKSCPLLLDPEIWYNMPHSHQSRLFGSLQPLCDVGNSTGPSVTCHHINLQLADTVSHSFVCSDPVVRKVRSAPKSSAGAYNSKAASTSSSDPYKFSSQKEFPLVPFLPPPSRRSPRPATTSTLDAHAVCKSKFIPAPVLNRWPTGLNKL